VADIPALRTGQMVDGTDTADILLVEYSDFGCFYCKKFHSEGTIKKLSEKY
jgi:protein-disulfide isomerase